MKNMRKKLKILKLILKKNGVKKMPGLHLRYPQKLKLKKNCVKSKNLRKLRHYKKK